MYLYIYIYIYIYFNTYTLHIFITSIQQAAPNNINRNITVHVMIIVAVLIDIFRMRILAQKMR